MKKHLLKTLALASAVVMGISLTANASVTMTFTWSGTLYQAGYSAQYINGSDAIGIYAFNNDGGQGISNPFYSVCLSPAGLLDGNQHTYNVVPFNSANPGIYPSAWAYGTVNNVPQYWGINNAAYLWSTYGMDIVNNTGSIGVQSQRAAALEFAIWTALYDSTGYGQLGAPNNWVAPTSQMDGTTGGYYNQYVAALTSAGLTGPLYTGNVLEGQGAGAGPNTGQSQEFFMLGTPIPEPTTMIAGALLLLPFGASTLRILRKNRAA